MPQFGVSGTLNQCQSRISYPKFLIGRDCDAGIADTIASLRLRAPSQWGSGARQHYGLAGFDLTFGLRKVMFEKITEFGNRRIGLAHHAA